MDLSPRPVGNVDQRGSGMSIGTSSSGPLGDPPERRKTIFIDAISMSQMTFLAPSARLQLSIDTKIEHVRFVSEGINEAIYTPLPVYITTLLQKGNPFA